MFVIGLVLFLPALIVDLIFSQIVWPRDFGYRLPVREWPPVTHLFKLAGLVLVVIGAASLL